MQAMILDDDPHYQALVARALMARGFMVVCVDSLAAAEAVVRLDMLDLVILGERVQGRLSHNVALLADCRVPAVPSVLVTDRTGEEIAELFELIPAIYSILGRRTAPSMVAQIAVAAVTAGPARHEAPGTEGRRVAARQAAAADRRSSFETEAGNGLATFHDTEVAKGRTALHAAAAEAKAPACDDTEAARPLLSDPQQAVAATARVPAFLQSEAVLPREPASRELRAASPPAAAALPETRWAPSVAAAPRASLPDFSARFAAPVATQPAPAPRSVLSPVLMSEDIGAGWHLPPAASRRITLS